MTILYTSSFMSTLSLYPQSSFYVGNYYLESVSSEQLSCMIFPPAQYLQLSLVGQLSNHYSVNIFLTKKIKAILPFVTFPLPQFSF